jgi:hypothetical protein
MLRRKTFRLPTCHILRTIVESVELLVRYGKPREIRKLRSRQLPRKCAQAF